MLIKPEQKRVWHVVAAWLMISLLGIAGCAHGSGPTSTEQAGSPPTATTRSTVRETTRARVPCGGRGLAVRLAKQGSTGGLMVAVGIRNVASRPCELDSTLRFELSGPSGRPAKPVNSNPSNLRIHQAIGPRASVTGLWHWLNWCGPAHAFRATAKLSAVRPFVRAGSAVNIPAHALPVCADQSAPSTLTLVTQPGPGYIRVRKLG